NALCRAVAAPTQDAADTAEQRCTQARLGPVDWELRHYVTKNDLGQGMFPGALEPIDDAVAKLAHNVNGERPADQGNCSHHHPMDCARRLPYQRVANNCYEMIKWI